MLALLDQATTPLVADEAEAAIAKVASDRLMPLARAGADIKLVVQGKAKVLVSLPARAVQIIVRILDAMAEQKPFSIVPHEAELTTQQASDYLNVSRPFLTKIVDSGEIKARLVGRHRRVRFSDLMAYEARSRVNTKEALSKIASEAQRLKLD